MTTACTTSPPLRTYHGTSSVYVLPNDEVEHRRLNSQASAIVEMLDGNPFLGSQYAKDVTKVIDIGCGTGVATIQLSHRFSSAAVYGIDLSSVPDAVVAVAPPAISWVRGNVLEVSNNTLPEQPSTIQKALARESVDYAFARLLMLGISNWERFFTIAAAALKPGAILEHQDIDLKWYRIGTNEQLCADWEWANALRAASMKCGLSPTAASDSARLMTDNGLEVLDTQSFMYSVVESDLAPKSKAVARQVASQWMQNLPDLFRKLMPLIGVGGETLERYISDCLRDITSEGGLYMKYIVTVAKKP